MKKVSTATAKQNSDISAQRLTIGFDLGDRSSWYCVLDEAGSVRAKSEHDSEGDEGSVRGMPRSRIALETGMHSP
jgi:transposase